MPWALASVFSTVAGLCLLVLHTAASVRPALLGLLLFGSFGALSAATLWLVVLWRFRDASFRWVALPWLIALGTWLAAFLCFPSSRVGEWGFVVALPMLMGLVALSSAARGLEARDQLAALSFGAGALLGAPAVGGVTGWFGPACGFYSLSRSECGAEPTLEATALTLACNVTVAVVLPLGLARFVRAHPRARSAATPLTALAVLAASRAVVCLCSALAAREVARFGAVDHAGGLETSRLEPLALVADVVGGLGVALAVAVLVTSVLAAREKRRSTLALGLWLTAPVACVALVSSSAWLSPPFFVRRMQAFDGTLPAGLEPLRRTHGAGDVVSVSHTLSAQGTIARVEGARSSPDRVEVLPDRRATVRQLLGSAASFAPNPEIVIAWRRHALEDASFARRRWPFVELSASAVSGRTIYLVDDVEVCEPRFEHADATYTRCRLGADRTFRPREVLVLRDAGPMSLETWLDSLDAMPLPVALSVPRAEPVLPGAAEPYRLHPLLLRWGSEEHETFWLLGLALGVLAARLDRRRDGPAWLAQLLGSRSDDRAREVGAYRSSAAHETWTRRTLGPRRTISWRLVVAVALVLGPMTLVSIAWVLS
jgi:hypothetical protein